MTIQRAPLNTSLHIQDPGFRIETRLDLPDDEVHLWRIDLPTLAGQSRWQEILSEAERSRAARFHFTRDRDCYTVTRALLRTILAGYLETDPRSLQFAYSEKEKPSLAAPRTVAIEFNVSHSGSVALLAFARGKLVGVDVEQIRADFDHEKIAVRFFSENERKQLSALAPSARPDAFFRCWARKESYIKAVGTGLSLPLRDFDVSLKPGDENALLATRPDSSEASRWSLREVPAGEGYAAALCVRGHNWKLKI